MAKFGRRFRAAQIASAICSCAFVMIYRVAQSLCVLALPITVAALVVAGVSGHSNFTSGARPEADGENGLVKKPKPFRLGVAYYTREFVDVVEKSRERGRDPLASFDALESAWRDASHWPFAIKCVEVSYDDPTTERLIARTSQPTVVIDQTNFAALLPLLRELQTLILEGGGVGRGKLPQSQRFAEPVNREKWHILEQPEFDDL